MYFQFHLFTVCKAQLQLMCWLYASFAFSQASHLTSSLVQLSKADN